MHRWDAWHLHLPTLEPHAQDRVVDEVVGPAVDWLQARGGGVEWFFVRYWQHGPHIRFRVANLGSSEIRELDQRLRALMIAPAPQVPLTTADYRRHVAPVAAAGEGGTAIDAGALWPAGVYRQPYRPETDRYGGQALLRRSESLFVTASQLALAFTRLAPPESARAGLGLQALAAALQVLPDEDRRLWFCRRSGVSWRRWAGLDGPVPLPASLTDELAGRIRSPTPRGLVRQWVEELGAAFPAWGADLAAEGILHSHIHMLHNRLGLSVGQELAHYEAVAGVLARPVAAARS